MERFERSAIDRALRQNTSNVGASVGSTELCGALSDREPVTTILLSKVIAPMTLEPGRIL